MSKAASKFQEAFMSRIYRGKEIFKPLNTGWIDENVACVREYVANIFFYTKNGKTIMIDAGYNYDRLKEKMGWLNLEPSSIEHILITHQDTDHIGAVEADSNRLFRHAKLYIGEIENRYLTGEVRRKVMGGWYKLPKVKIENEKTLLKDGAVFTIEGIKIEAFLVAGHTWGHLVYLIDDAYLFTGDTIWFGMDGGYSFINKLAEDNELAKKSLSELEKKLRERSLSLKIITGHTGWTSSLDFAFAHSQEVCNPGRKVKVSDPEAPFDAYDESDDTEDQARGCSLKAYDDRSRHENIITASKRYQFVNGIADYSNHIFGGIVKRYMKNQMKPQKEPIEFPEKYKKRATITKEDYQGRPIYTLRPRKELMSDREIIFLHGGGGLMPPTSLHFETAVSIVEETGAPLHFLMYPLAPKANCADAVAWLEAWYENRAKQAPHKRFFVIGDSAGAGLSTAFCSGGRKQVEGVILISPAASLDEKERYMTRYEEHDILLSMRMIDAIAGLWSKGMEMTDPRLNSSYVDYIGFPKTMIIYGGREMFAGTIPLLTQKMTEAGVDLSVYKGEIHCHDWVLAQSFPESRQALKHICAFIESGA